MNNLYLYFSGTGNTKYVLKELIQKLGQTDAILQSIEYNHIDYSSLIEQATNITIAYPIYGSMMPIIMKDFIDKYKSRFSRKQINVVVTQRYFSGDGAALACRLLRPVNPVINHTIHINMPINTPDIPFMHTKTLAESKNIITKADHQIDRITNKIKQGKTIKMGRRWYSWLAGFFVQRIFMIPLHSMLRKRLMINHETCISCNECVPLCPENNLFNDNGTIKTNNQCTLCYRCINSCPTKSISLFTKKGPSVQYIQKDYN